MYKESLMNGMLTELECTKRFIKLGFTVSIPYGNNDRYDMIIDNGNNMYRIQIKTAHKNDNGSYTVQVCNKVNTMSQNKIKHYTKEQIDFIVTIIEDQLVVIPVETIENSTQKIFRTELPKSGTTSHCNLIKDFSVEKNLLYHTDDAG